MSATAIPRTTALPTAHSRVRDDPAWVRPALLAVLAASAVLVLWGLTASGYSNTYYAAAAKAGSVSWKAWFFGSLDPGSFITVDKPPLALWLMGLSARVFGFSSFSILLPQALCTIASVGLLFATVKRVFGPAAGIVAAAALAITPVTVAIGRVNNPDALLVLLMIGAAYLTVRAIESGRTRTLAWAGVVVGLAFMTKMLQGWMVAPALAAAYLLAAPHPIGCRIRQLLVAGGAMVVAGAAWPLAVTLWPGDRPFIGGSTDGGVWDLILGYNGFGRLFGGEGGAGGMSFGGAAGLWRMCNAQVGGQVAWLLPLAVAGLAAGLYLQRTRMARAGYALFGVWALTHVLVFSFQKGIFHPYYVSALAPAVAALCGGGLVAMVRWARESWTGVGVLAAVVLGTAELAVALLQRTPDFAPWLHPAILVAAVIAAAATVGLKLGLRHVVAIGAVAGVFALSAGPAAYSVATAGRSLNGNNVSAGPASANGRGGFGGGGGETGGVSSSRIAYLQKHQGSARYLVAAFGSQTTASIIIATGEPVVTIGGFSGSDNAPTVSELAAMVKKGELRYVLLSGNGGGRGGPGGGGSSSSISEWVQSHGTEVSDGLWKVSA